MVILLSLPMRADEVARREHLVEIVTADDVPENDDATEQR